MAIMDLVEDIKESIPSGTYLDIMNQLMALNKEQEILSPIPHIHGSEAFDDDSDDEDYIMDYFRNLYHFDRVGNANNLYNDISANHQYQGNWVRTGQGTWVPRSGFPQQ